MEGKVSRSAMHKLLLPVLLGGLWCNVPDGVAQEKIGQNDESTAEISLRKTIDEREYKGHKIEGSERDVRPGDTMWHILIREKGLAPDRFKEYFVLVRGLNPDKLTTPEVLHVGDKIFIPLKPDEALRLQAAPAKADEIEGTETARGKTRDYTVKSGDHLYQILRAQLGVSDDRKLWQYFALVKDLNPQKTNWDVIEKGETIRLPVAGAEASGGAVAYVNPPARNSAASGNAAAIGETRVAKLPPVPSRPAAPPAIDLDYARRLSARENFALLGMVAESLGNEVQNSGEEVVALKHSAIRLDKNKFPVVYNRALDQRVILDTTDNIPGSLRANLNQQSVNTPVVTVAENTTVQEAVGQLLARLGYQPLPAERPVVVREGGVSVEAKGQWVVTAPEQSNKPQEIIVINLTDGSGKIPEDLKAHLGTKGLHLKNVPVEQSAGRVAHEAKNDAQGIKGQIKKLPGDKSEMIDAMLAHYQVPFGVKEPLSVELRGGLRVDITADRMLELRNRKTALFFRAIDPAVKAALEQKQGLRSLELDFEALKSRDIVSKLLAELGENATYKDHQFSAASGVLKDRLILTAAGFHLSSRSIFLTDQEIPAQFQRVFFENGLDIVYFD
ncbi:MAG: hypothetical protein OEN50_03005 [Deltaproteobacteria bacterium]|nr:hypothetical protein [Deltaproteobacteria bacterium]